MGDECRARDGDVNATTDERRKKEVGETPKQDWAREGGGEKEKKTKTTQQQAPIAPRRHTHTLPYEHSQQQRQQRQQQSVGVFFLGAATVEEMSDEL